MFKVAQGDSNRSLKNYGFLYDAIFLFTCTHAHKSLSTEMQLLRKIAELEILLVCGECLKKACDSSANTVYIGSLWEETYCSVIDGKLQLKHASAAKKRDMNKNKKH